MNTAYVINSTGGDTEFAPTLDRGNIETTRFAALSSVIVNNKGVSLVIGKDASPVAIRKAIRILQDKL